MAAVRTCGNQQLSRQFVMLTPFARRKWPRTGEIQPQLGNSLWQHPVISSMPIRPALIKKSHDADFIVAVARYPHASTG